MKTFLKEAKRKQKWMTFAGIHRLAYQRNNLPCAKSILKHVSPEVCLLGHQWISRGFTLTRYLGKGSVPSIYADSLDTDYPRNEGRLANRFFPRKILWVFLWDPTVKRQYSKIQQIRASASKNLQPNIFRHENILVSSLSVLFCQNFFRMAVSINFYLFEPPPSIACSYIYYFS